MATIKTNKFSTIKTASIFPTLSQNYDGTEDLKALNDAMVAKAEATKAVVKAETTIIVGGSLVELKKLYTEFPSFAFGYRLPLEGEKGIQTVSNGDFVDELVSEFTVYGTAFAGKAIRDLVKARQMLSSGIPAEMVISSLTASKKNSTVLKSESVQTAIKAEMVAMYGSAEVSTSEKISKYNELTGEIKSISTREEELRATKARSARALKSLLA